MRMQQGHHPAAQAFLQSLVSPRVTAHDATKAPVAVEVLDDMMDVVLGVVVCSLVGEDQDQDGDGDGDGGVAAYRDPVLPCLVYPNSWHHDSTCFCNARWWFEAPKLESAGWHGMVVMDRMTTTTGVYAGRCNHAARTILRPRQWLEGIISLRP